MPVVGPRKQPLALPPARWRSAAPSSTCPSWTRTSATRTRARATSPPTRSTASRPPISPSAPTPCKRDLMRSAKWSGTRATSIGPRKKAALTARASCPKTSPEATSTRSDASELVPVERAPKRAVPERAARSARPHAERALEVFAPAEHGRSMPAKSAQRGTELVIERLQWLAAAGFQPFAVRHVQQQLSGRVQRPDLAGVLYRDMDGDPRCPSVRPRRVHRFRVAVGSEDRRRLHLESGELGAQARENGRVVNRRARPPFTRQAALRIGGAACGEQRRLDGERSRAAERIAQRRRPVPA